MNDAVTCPACGGSGGGPFGPPGSAWDVEDYRCPRCAGRGFIPLVEPVGARPPLAKGGGLAATPRFARAGSAGNEKAPLARTKATDRRAAASAGRKKRQRAGGDGGSR